MNCSRILSAATAATLLTALLPAQIQAFGGPGTRAASTIIYFDTGTRTPAGGIAVQYGQGEWKDEYNQMMEQKGQRHRFGKDWWTTLDTSVRLEFGRTIIPAGSYFLGLESDQEGNFHLLVIDSHTAMVQGQMPFMPDTWKPNHKIALHLNKNALDKPADKLTIDVTAGKDDPSKVALTISWGPHRLAAGGRANLGGGKGDEHGDKDGGHDAGKGEGKKGGHDAGKGDGKKG